MPIQAIVREINFDCLVGPSHFFGGLSLGNLASTHNKSTLSNPKKAALQGLEKMRYLARAGFAQAVLPPHERPHIKTLERLGFIGSAQKILEDAYHTAPELFLKTCSSSAMWAANAATVCPKSDASDNKTHITPANLVTMFHRSIEPCFTTKIFKKIFNNQSLFCVHEPLPAHEFFADEGAANHNRLCPTHGLKGLHVFVHGKALAHPILQTKKFSARQSLLANEALARNHMLNPEQILHLAQNPAAIDAGAFHNDVVAVANESVFLCHELAFYDQPQALKALESKFKALYQESPHIIIVDNHSLPLKDAVSSYLFNSQLLSKANGRMLLFAPTEALKNSYSQAVINKIIQSENPIDEVIYFDISESMMNGGGPACLRLRIPLQEHEIKALSPQIFFDELLFERLSEIIARYYFDNLELPHLFEQKFQKSSQEALEHISQALGLHGIYEFKD